MDNRKLVSFVIVALVVGVVVGYWIGGKSSTPKISSGAGQRLAVQSVGNFSGTIKSFDGKSLVVELLGNKAGESKEVSVSTDTKIFKLEKKTDEAYQKEVSTYRIALSNFQKNPESSVPPVPVSRIAEIPASVTDLISGIRVSVISDSNLTSKITIQITPVKN